MNAYLRNNLPSWWTSFTNHASHAGSAIARGFTWLIANWLYAICNGLTFVVMWYFSCWFLQWYIEENEPFFGDSFQKLAFWLAIAACFWIAYYEKWGPIGEKVKELWVASAPRRAQFTAWRHAQPWIWCGILSLTFMVVSFLLDWNFIFVMSLLATIACLITHFDKWGAVGDALGEAWSNHVWPGFKEIVSFCFWFMIHAIIGKKGKVVQFVVGELCLVWLAFKSINMESEPVAIESLNILVRLPIGWLILVGAIAWAIIAGKQAWKWMNRSDAEKAAEKAAAAAKKKAEAEEKTAEHQKKIDELRLCLETRRIELEAVQAEAAVKVIEAEMLFMDRLGEDLAEGRLDQAAYQKAVLAKLVKAEKQTRNQRNQRQNQQN